MAAKTIVSTSEYGSVHPCDTIRWGPFQGFMSDCRVDVGVMDHLGKVHYCIETVRSSTLSSTGSCSLTFQQTFALEATI